VVNFHMEAKFQPVTSQAIRAIQDADTALLGVPQQAASFAMGKHREALRPLWKITGGVQ
jgi:hypothetical protein